MLPWALLIPKLPNCCYSECYEHLLQNYHILKHIKTYRLLNPSSNITHSIAYSYEEIISIQNLHSANFVSNKLSECISCSMKSDYCIYINRSVFDSNFLCIVLLRCIKIFKMMRPNYFLMIKFNLLSYKALKIRTKMIIFWYIIWQLPPILPILIYPINQFQ